MVFYFSGTGNSYAVARHLAQQLGEELVNIATATKEKQFAYILKSGEKLGFVFPVYAWAPPKMVTDFVEELEVYFKEQPYTYGVCTCGGSAGDSMGVLERSLHRNGLMLDSGFSVLMPDNYVVAFPIVSPSKQAMILAKAEETTEHILRAICLEKREFFRVQRGRAAVALTKAVNPGFSAFALKTKKFTVNDTCIGCGLCERVCTSDCIRMLEDTPVWIKTTCNMCLACLHRCPKASIQYGRKTEGKGRYLHPILRNRLEK